MKRFNLLNQLVFFLLIVGISTNASATGSAALAPKHANYNVIMVWIDALRADHLGYYGYPRKTSPNLDKLAQESVVFENNFSVHPVTIASFMSIITSLYPISHGVLYVAKDKLSPEIKTLAQILKLFDYSTGWFGPDQDPQLDPNIGFGRGFDTIENFPPELNNAQKTLLNWVSENKDKRFFLNFHTYKVHDPYMPAPEYKQIFTTAKVEAVAETWEDLQKATYYLIQDGLNRESGIILEELGEASETLLRNKNLFAGAYSQEKLRTISGFFKDHKIKHKWDNIRSLAYESQIDINNPEVLNHLINLYDASILEFDSKIMGPLIAHLKKLNLYHNTLIIICADHGDEFGEHGDLLHGETLYDEVLHVPLIIKVPGVGSGKRVKELTQTVDILPTILDLLHIPIPHHAQGVSLLPYINDEGRAPLREYVYGQLPYMATLRSKEWKFSKHDNGNKELFDLIADPGEQNNLYYKTESVFTRIKAFFRPKSESMKNRATATGIQAVASKLEQDLIKWEDSLPSYRVDSPFLPHIDKATQEKIKKTGYW
jgi:arylsulfatase A-like enzyme